MFFIIKLTFNHDTTLTAHSSPPILATETLSGTPAVMEQVESTAILPTTDYAAPAPALDPAVALAADPLAVEYEPLIMEVRRHNS